MTRSCAHCGAALAAGARFCENCGQPVAPQAAAHTAGARAQAAAGQPAKKWLIIGLAGAALVILLGCGLFGGIALLRLLRPAAVASQVVVPPPATEVIVIPATPTVEPLQPAEASTEAPATETQPEPLPSSTPEPSPAFTSYDFAGVTFTYDPALAAAVEPERVAAQAGADLPPWELAPEHQRLTFLGYPLADTFHQPQIFIYPVQEYLEVDPGIGDRLATLQQMLLVRTTEGLPEPLPFFPSWNAGQVLAVQVKYLDFKNGSGVRYLTQYGQGIYPVSSQTLFYTFQGLSSDGRWLVSAVLPVASPVLPDPESVLQDPSFEDNYAAYLEEVKGLLGEQPDSSFQPDLAALDAIFQSLEVR